MFLISIYYFGVFMKYLQHITFVQIAFLCGVNLAAMNEDFFQSHADSRFQNGADSSMFTLDMRRICHFLILIFSIQYICQIIF